MLVRCYKTLYVNDEFKESLELDDIDPERIQRVVVYDANPFGQPGAIDLVPVAFPLRRGNRYIVLIETK